LKISSGEDPEAVNITGNCQPSNLAEAFENLFDNDLSTKWYSAVGAVAHMDINPYHI
jgi:hypothetical protein